MAALTSLVVLLFLLLSTISAQSAVFNIPSGNVTALIEAIQKANSTPEPDTILLEPGVYILTAVDNDLDGPNGLPSIESRITIRQDEQNATIERDPSAVSFRIFHVAASGNLRLYGLGIRNGFFDFEGLRENNGGAAIFNLGTLKGEQLSIYNNAVNRRDGVGGGILNLGNATLVDTEVKFNSAAFHAPSGGGIFNGGVLRITRGLIQGNRGSVEGGGGIVSKSKLTIRDSAIVENVSNFQGGGLLLDGGARIVNTTIARNVLTIQGFGAGIALSALNNPSGIFRIINSTIAENRVTFGDGGAGINNHRSFPGIIDMQNTIVAFNVNDEIVREIPADCSGSIVSLGHNITGDLRGCDITLQSSDLIGNPGLGDFRGTYYPLLPDSPAIDSANSRTCPTTDQLGNARDGGCDRGSIEFQSGSPVAIDIRPRDETNTVRPKVNTTVPVAILGNENFDASSVNPATVRFGPNQTPAIDATRLRDVNGDGRLDLILRFRTHETGVSCKHMSMFLSGQTYEAVRIFGYDVLKPLACPKTAGAFR